MSSEPTESLLQMEKTGNGLWEMHGADSVAQTQVCDRSLQIACNYLVINHIATPSQLPLATFPLSPPPCQTRDVLVLDVKYSCGCDFPA